MSTAGIADGLVVGSGLGGIRQQFGAVGAGSGSGGAAGGGGVAGCAVGVGAAFGAASDGGVPSGRNGTNDSAGAPLRAVAMKPRHTSPGSVRPLIGSPVAVRIGELRSVPIHTEAASCGVNPAIHASLFSPGKRDCTVPVFAATGRRPSVRPSRSATPSIASVTLRATCSGKRCSPSGRARYSTRPSAVTTCETRCGGCHTPPPATVAYAEASSSVLTSLLPRAMPSFGSSSGDVMPAARAASATFCGPTRRAMSLKTTLFDTVMACLRSHRAHSAPSALRRPGRAAPSKVSPMPIGGLSRSPASTTKGLNVDPARRRTRA